MASFSQLVRSMKSGLGIPVRFYCKIFLLCLLLSALLHGTYFFYKITSLDVNSTDCPGGPCFILSQRSHQRKSHSLPRVVINKVGVDPPQRTRYGRIKIPKILHQTWDTEEIPVVFKEWIESWRRINPEWEYWLWTQKDIRALVNKLHPEFLDMYDAYDGQIFRADVMRYFVLYQFGGVYADLDVEALKPMDDLLYTDCFLSLEPEAHASLLYNMETPAVMTTIIGCRPKHPFFELVIKLLPQTAHKHNVLYATGPFFLNSAYNTYMDGPQHADYNSLTVLKQKYLLPTFDDVQMHIIGRLCSSPKVLSILMAYQQKTCRKLLRVEYWNKPTEESYTNHHWYHANVKAGALRKMETINIDDLVEGRRNITKVIRNL